MSGEDDDHGANEVVAPEVRLRGGTADHPHVPAERVVQAIERVPATPHSERNGHPRCVPATTHMRIGCRTAMYLR
jgi:hypothetical protein